MRLCVTFFTLLIACLSSAKANDYKVVCYFGSWAVYRTGNGQIQISDIDPTLCTHLIYTFIGITTEGEISILDPWADLPDDGGRAGYQKFNALREQSPETKTLVAIGGWNEGSVKYSTVAADATLRSKFVKNVVDFVLLYEFDGFDVDWEYPGQRGGSSADVDNFSILLKELREALDEHGLILSAAVAAAESSASLSYDIPRVSEYLHFVNIMTYDFHGSWDATTGHNAPLYHSARETTAAELALNVNATVHYWLAQGAPAEKLILGTGFYGRSFTLIDSTQNLPGSAASGAGSSGPYTQESGMLGYNEICEYEAQGYWTSAWDEEQRVPYAYSGNQWVSYDDVKSVTEKAEYIRTLGLGGAMLWSIETDDFRGMCGEKFPLLKALNNVLRGSGSSAAGTSETTINEDDFLETSEAGKETSTKADENSASENQTEDDNDGDDQASKTVCTSAGFVRDSEDCSKFWFCHESGDVFWATSFSCPKNLYFDQDANVCNYAELVDC